MAVSAQDNRVVFNEEDLSYINGVLRIEIKDVSKLYDNDAAMLYVWVNAGDVWKRVRVTPSGTNNNKRRMLIPLFVPTVRAHPSNLVCLNVAREDSSPAQLCPDRVIGTVAFHLHDVIKQSPVDGVFDLFDAYQTVGEIKLSLAFSYGLFGYGYSLQLKEDNYTTDHFLKYSLFPRIDPIAGRTDPVKHLLVPKANRHPSFIPFNQRVQLGFGQDIAPSLDSTHENGGKFSLIAKNLNRFSSLQDNLKREPSRFERLSFLRDLVLDSNKKIEVVKEEDDEVAGNHDHGNERNNKLYSSFVALSLDEMKEKGLLVVSLPKEQEKTQADSETPTSNNPPSSSNGSPLSSTTTPPSITSPSSSSSSSLSRNRSSTSFRPLSLPSDSTSIPSSSPASLKLADAPANPQIQRLKNM